NRDGCVGGVDGARRKFNLEYWANSYAAAVRGVEDSRRHEYGAVCGVREVTVAVCGPPISARYYFPDNFRLVHRQDRAEFFIAFTKDDCDGLFPGIPVYGVDRMGAFYSMVLDRSDIPADHRMVTRPVPAAVTTPRPASPY